MMCAVRMGIDYTVVICAGLSETFDTVFTGTSDLVIVYQLVVLLHLLGYFTFYVITWEVGG